jgi:gliding motility-associated-like protein
VFRPEGKGIADYSLQVFNRWGILVFESTQYNNGWNGKVNNEPAPAGTYYFLLMAKDSNGRSLLDVDVYAGEVSLLR